MSDQIRRSEALRLWAEGARLIEARRYNDAIITLTRSIQLVDLVAVARADEREVDQFDNDNAIYLLALDENGRVLGGSRLTSSLKPHLLGSEVMGNASAYGVGGVHRHTPEITQNLAAVRGGEVRVSFTPMLVPMSRGILATVQAPLLDGVTAEQVRDAYAAAYDSEPFVHLLPDGQWPQTQSVLGSNAVQVQVAVDERVRRLVAVAVVDNRAKGTAGAAVQCMNLALGLDEATGLSTIGLAP